MQSPPCDHKHTHTHTHTHIHKVHASHLLLCCHVYFCPSGLISLELQLFFCGSVQGLLLGIKPVFFLLHDGLSEREFASCAAAAGFAESILGLAVVL